MERIIIQIYEIQTPSEAESILELAGGISPGNVSDGIMKVQPFGVDSCTQTNAADHAGNSIRFKKDKEKVKQLVEAVRDAERMIQD